jgi:hypothetical protein
MSGTVVFDHVAEALESATSLDRLEARGTLRLTLKDAGFDPRGVRAEEMKAVIEKVLAKELSSRGIDDAAAICERLAASVAAADFGSAAGGESSPEDVFRRLGGS